MRANERVNEWLNDDGENVQTKINSICLHVKMCMSDCRKTRQKLHFSLYPMWNGLWTSTTLYTKYGATKHNRDVNNTA